MYGVRSTWLDPYVYKTSKRSMCRRDAPARISRRPLDPLRYSVSQSVVSAGRKTCACRSIEASPNVELFDKPVLLSASGRNPHAAVVARYEHPHAPPVRRNRTSAY